MKLFRKVMSLIIASIMMLQVAAFAAPAPADVNGTFYEDAAKLLSALEVMVGDGNSFNGENNITRAEFTKIMVAAAGNANIVAGYKPKGVFTDVPTTEWYAPYVEFGKDMGAINGMGEGIFAPNENVTGEQAIKMMVCIIGYGLPAAEIGYPEGYVSVARDLGALKGITNVDLTKPMTRGQAAVLCANIMKVDVMKKIAAGDKEQWASQEGVTLLSSKFSAYEEEGIVSANSTTAVNGVSDLKPEEVEITVGGDKKIFFIGETDINTKLGATVEFVYHFDTDTKDATVLCYTASEKDNKSVTVDFEQFELEGGKIAVEDGELLYWPTEDAKKAETIEIEVAYPAIIYNGVASTTKMNYKDFLDDKLDRIGNVTFIDANGIDGAETLVVTAYENFVVDYIDPVSYTISDANDRKNILEFFLDDDDVTAVFVDKDGKELSFDDLQEGDVLSVAKSDAETGKRYIHAIVCDDTVTGIVASFNNAAGEKFGVNLKDDKDYVFDHVMRASEEAKTNFGLKFGKEVTFKLDAFGQIAAIDAAEAGDAQGEFGLLLEYKVDEQIIDDPIMAKVFTAAGEREIFTFANKVTIDGEKYTGSDEIKGALGKAIQEYCKKVESKFATSELGIVPMLYELDAAGAIKYIDTPALGAKEDAKYSLGAIKGDDGSLTTRNYNSFYKGFDYSTPFNASAQLLALPQSGNFADEDSIFFAKNTDLAPSESKQDVPCEIQLFNTNRESYTYTYGIYVTTKSAAGDNAFQIAADDSAARKRPLFVVRKATIALAEDEYGEDVETLRVYGIEEGAEKDFIVDPEYYAEGACDETGTMDTLLNHVYYGKTFNESASSVKGDLIKHTAPMSEKRRNQILMQGDVVTYGLNADGLAQYVRTIFLYEEKAFKSHNFYDGDRLLGSTNVYIPVQIEGKEARLSNVTNTAGGFIPMVLDVDETTRLIKQDYAGNAIPTKDDKDNHYAENMAVSEVRNIGSAKVMVIDLNAANDKQRVKVGSLVDIVDAQHPINPATPIIVRNFNNGVASIVVLKSL